MPSPDSSGWSVVELEAHEPKGIYLLYSVSYLSIKTHVQ